MFFWSAILIYVQGFIEHYHDSLEVNFSDGVGFGKVTIPLFMVLVFMANINGGDVIQSIHGQDQKLVASIKSAVIGANIIINWLSWIMSTNVIDAPSRLTKTKVCFSFLMS